jgi:hypothetical protein
VFDEPSADDLAAASFDPAAAGRLRAAPWWGEMVAEILDAPAQRDDADDEPAAVLHHARDLVGEYPRERFEP